VLIICWFGVRILAGAPIEISKLRTIKSCPFLPWAGCDGFTPPRHIQTSRYDSSGGATAWRPYNVPEQPPPDLEKGSYCVILITLPVNISVTNTSAAFASCAMLVGVTKQLAITVGVAAGDA